MGRRIEFSRKVRRAIIERAAGKCESCGAALKPGEAEVDHILPCALGGVADQVNGMCLCRVCHAAKTADDIRRVRKADRQRDKASGAIRPEGKIKGRGFDRSPKPKRIEKKPLPPRALFQPKEGRP